MSTHAISPMERERTVVTGLLVVLVVLWWGFTVHRSPRFPGSLLGTLLGIAGAALMVLPSLAYVAVKRVPSLKQRVITRLPMRRLLTWHLWGGIVGAVLVILHGGHRFASALGIGLTSATLLVVFSGYVGRHFLGKVSLELRDKQALLAQLMNAYNRMARDAAVNPEVPKVVARRAAELAGSIADLEYAIQTHELLKRRFRIWFVAHVATSMIFYGLLGLHIWATLYFGLRWLA